MRVAVPRRGRVDLVQADLPAEIADQIDPSANDVARDARTNYTGVPWSGEAREEKAQTFSPIIPGGPEIIACTLQRPWPMVGYGIFAGDLPGGGGANLIVAKLYALVKGARVLIAVQNIAGALPAFGQVVQCGARAELAFQVASANPAVNGVQAALWGSPFR